MLWRKPGSRPLLDNARRNLERLWLLADDLVAAKRLLAGAAPPAREPIPLDLRAAVGAAVAPLAATLGRRGQVLACEPPVVLSVRGDPTQLEQVVSSLLANAHDHAGPEEGAMHILIAEDSPDVAEVVAFSARLTWPDATVTTATGGAEALDAFAARPADLVILDVNMPPPDGYAVCQQIRERSDVPILMLTVRDSIVDKMRGFDLGVDDYLTKPFDHLELMARMRALMRRASRHAPGGEALSAVDISLDEAARTVVVRGAPITLTSTEYRLLSFLMQHAGTVLPHQRILEAVWGESYRHDTHYLKVFVRRLRQKLGDDATQPRYIQTEWGVGYRFAGPSEQHEAETPEQATEIRGV